MVVLVFVSDAEVETDLIQKVGFGQLHAFGFEVVAHIEDQTVGAFAQTGVVIEHAVGIAAVVVQGEAFNQGGLIALRGEKRDLHACGWAAVHGVQYVCAQSHGFARLC